MFEIDYISYWLGLKLIMFKMIIFLYSILPIR